MKNKLSLLLCAIPMALCTTACNFKTPEFSYTTSRQSQINSLGVDQSRLYGVCDMAFEEYDWRSEGSKIDYHESHKLISALGATTVRFWTNFYYIMNTPTTLVNFYKYRELRTMYEDLMEKNPDVTVIGLNHSNYLNGTMTNSKKPRRDLSPNS